MRRIIPLTVVLAVLALAQPALANCCHVQLYCEHQCSQDFPDLEICDWNYPSPPTICLDECIEYCEDTYSWCCGFGVEEEREPDDVCEVVSDPMPEAANSSEGEMPEKSI